MERRDVGADRRVAEDNRGGLAVERRVAGRRLEDRRWASRRALVSTWLGGLLFSVGAFWMFVLLLGALD